jgi:hypothetical protein
MYETGAKLIGLSCDFSNCAVHCILLYDFLKTCDKLDSNAVF